MSEIDFCTCRQGRDYDGSEFGPCAYCESVADRERHDAAIVRDAARWRISQICYVRLMDSPYGYFRIKDDDGESVGIQPHPVSGSTAINHCIMGLGETEAAAIDGMFLSLNAYLDEGATLPSEIAAICRLFNGAAP